nr:smad nuclear interacting protein 1 [Quercus suber]
MYGLRSDLTMSLDQYPPGLKGDDIFGLGSSGYVARLDAVVKMASTRFSRPHRARKACLRTGSTMQAPWSTAILWSSTDGRFNPRIAETFAFLHSKGIFHADISCNNVFLDQDWHAKVADFAGASIDGQEALGCYEFGYDDPRNDDVVSTTSEIFALGSMFYEIMTGTKPYQALKPGEVQVAFRQGEFPSTASLVNYGATIQRCWSRAYKTTDEFAQDVMAEALIEANATGSEYQQTVLRVSPTRLKPALEVIAYEDVMRDRLKLALAIEKREVKVFALVNVKAIDSVVRSCLYLWRSLVVLSSKDQAEDSIAHAIKRLMKRGSDTNMPRSDESRGRSDSGDHRKFSSEQRGGSDYDDERRDPQASRRPRDYSGRSDRREADDGRRDHHHQHARHHSSRNYDSTDRSDRRHRSRSPGRSRHDRDRDAAPVKRRQKSKSRSRSPVKRSRAPLASQDESFRGGKNGDGPGAPPIVKEKPNYKPTGLLAKEANTVAGTTTVLKYHEPPEARKPPAKQQWRMYVFKQQDLMDTIYLYQRSVWLVGRDKLITDLFVEHPSISKQHAVIQFRHINSTNEYGDKTSKVKPYLLDLESANGTKLNGRPVEASRFIELVDADVIKFGDSEREYVLMLPPAD